MSEQSKESDGTPSGELDAPLIPSSSRDAPPDLLSSPIERTLVNRIFVIGGPLGLAIAIVLSLWVSYMHVERSVMVHVDQQWVVGEQLAIRAQFLDRDRVAVGSARVELTVVSRAGGSPVGLGTIEAADEGARAQGTFVVPDLPRGAADLHARFSAEGNSPLEETIPVQVVEARKPRPRTYTPSKSWLQSADDSQPQAPGMHVAVRPVGRLLAGFRNRVLVRVTQPDGTPRTGPVEVVLMDGEFMEQRGNKAEPPRLVLGSTDALGLLTLEGIVTSDVLRIEARVLGSEEPIRITHRRQVRLVSHPGAVQATIEPMGLVSDSPGKLRARGLSAKRSVYVDVYDHEGAWVDTLRPPFVGNEPEREWTAPVGKAGVFQLEAYHYANTPGESIAVARYQVVGADEHALTPLLERHRQLLELPRNERFFDVEHERAYLAAIEKAATTPEQMASARTWLLGTLPIEIYGPPKALETRAAEDEELKARKEAWTLGMRLFLLGGGGLFLLAMTVVMLRSHGTAAAATVRALSDVSSDEQRQEIAAHVAAARRAALVRGAGMILVMAGALVLTVLMLESLLWEF